MNTENNLEMNQEEFEEALKLVHKHTGIRMNSSKKTLLQSRLRPRVRILGFNSYKEYIQYLGNNKSEIQEFVNLVTTNETYFFRTQRVWDFFQNEFLPDWINKNPNKTLRIWSAASSTGEEAHTLGICCEEFRLKHPSFQFQISASDIDTEVIKVAEKGEYFGRSVDKMKKERGLLFEKYLEQRGEIFQVKDVVRNRLKFSQHNLFNPAPANFSFDIVFLRNVLIYFTADDQEKVLTHLSRTLSQNGILVIGESESLTNLKTPFKYKSPLIYEVDKL